MRDNLFWFLAFLLGIPLAIWDAVKRFFSWLFGKDEEDENGRN